MSLWACNPPGTESEAHPEHKQAGRNWGTPRLKGPPGPPINKPGLGFISFVQYMILHYQSKVWGHVFFVFPFIHQGLIN